jgi:hypothetical protein
MLQMIQRPTANRLELLRPEHDEELVSFLDSLADCPAGPIVLGYHYPENREMLLRVLGPDSHSCYLAARSRATGEIRAALPGMVKQTAVGACYNSLPFFGPNVGVLAAADDSEEYRLLALELTAAALDHARQCGAVTAVFYSAFNPTGVDLRNPMFDSLPGVIRVRRTTLYLRLPQSGEPVWPSAARRNVAKALRNGVQVTDRISPADLDRIYDIYSCNCAERGIPLKPRICIHAMSSASSGRVRTYTASLDNRIIAALMVLWGPQTASYYLPCVDHEHSSLQPLPLLINYACSDAIQHGKRFWNWEGSPGQASGVYRFKQKWGSVELPYEVVVVPLMDVARLRALGAKQLAALFPFYFVYPYHQL